MHFARRLHVCFLPFCAATLAALSPLGCSAPAALPPPPDAPPMAVTQIPTHRSLAVDAEGWLRGDGIELKVDRVVARSPSGSLLALAFIRGDSTHVAVIDLAQGLSRTAPLAPREREVTFAWRGDRQVLATGYFTREGEAMGAGDLVLVDPTTMNIRPSGCRASTIVYGWSEADRLLVGDGKAIHVVDAATCASQSTLSLLKKHHVAIAPSGRHVAYVFRELEYNREKRAYEPDSTLMLANIDGTNERNVAGMRYHPRNLAWSPDGARLAFDVTSQTDPALRHLAVYDVAAAEATFLVRATETVLPSESRPEWSPDGAFLAYDRVFVHGELYQKAVRSLADNAVHVVAEQPVSAGKLDVFGWTPTQVVLRAADGRHWLGTPGAARPLPLDVDGDLVTVF